MREFEIERQFQIKIDIIKANKGIYYIKTNKGERCLKKINYGPQKLLFVYGAKEHLIKNGFDNVDRYFLNISPSYMYEKMDCCIEITTKNIVDIYLNSYMESKYEEVLFKRLDAASNATKFLSNLRTYDTDNFLLLMKTMTEDARDYLNYLKKEDDVVN